MDPTLEPVVSAPSAIGPWSVLIGTLLPLIALMVFSKTYPTRRMGLVFALPCLAALLVPAFPGPFWMAVVALDLIVAIL